MTYVRDLAVLAASGLLVVALFAKRDQPAHDAPEAEQKPVAGAPETLRGEFIKFEDEFNRIQIRTDANVLHAIPLQSGAQIEVNGRPTEAAGVERGTIVVVRYAVPQGHQPAPAAAPEEKTPAKGAPEKAPMKGASAANLTLAYPTGDRATSVLLIETSGPDKPRVGEATGFQLKVTNLTKHLLLERVVLCGSAPRGVEIGNVGQANTQDGSKAATPAEQQGPQANAPRNRADAHHGDGPAPAQNQARRSQHRWVIESLRPGETRTFQVQVTGYEAGTQTLCLDVSYQPALCLSATFVQPELALTREAPREADICEPISIRYVVKNTGTAATRGLRVREELPDWLVADRDGQARREKDAAQKGNVIDLDVGALEPGQSREFRVRLVADRAGEFTGRAVAVTDGNLRVRSQQTTTMVRQANLAVEIDGPDTEYVKQRMTYRVTVRNRGDAPAQATRLQVEVGEPLAVLRTSREVDGRKREAPRQEGRPLEWDLGTLRPGEASSVELTALAQQKGEVRLTARAKARCAREVAGATAQAVIRTRLLVIPALQLTLVDKQDPVKIGGDAVYSVRVTNEGTGPDQDVRIRVQLPDQLEFAEAAGPTKAQARGQTVIFEPISSLEPGDTVEWTLRTKVKDAGDVRTRADLSSDYLRSPVPSVEPTRLIR